MTTTKIKIRVTLTEDMLGTASNDKDVHDDHIIGKSVDKDKRKEELAALPAEALIEKSLTVFPRDENGNPFLWDYQMRGFLKEALGTSVEFGKRELKKGNRKFSYSKWTYKRLIDNFVFVNPRKIMFELPEGEEMGAKELGYIPSPTPHCTRPLRADTQKGERIALATSETVPAGTTFECEILIRDDILVDPILECLDFGELKGLGQWRNSGKGRFIWEEVEEDKPAKKKKK